MSRLISPQEMHTSRELVFDALEVRLEVEQRGAALASFRLHRDLVVQSAELGPDAVRAARHALVKLFVELGGAQ